MQDRFDKQTSPIEKSSGHYSLTNGELLSRQVADMMAAHHSGDRFSEHDPRIGPGGGGAGGGTKADAPGPRRSDDSHKYFDCEDNPFQLVCPEGQKILDKSIQEKLEKNQKDHEKKPDFDGKEKVLDKQKRYHHQ